MNAVIAGLLAFISTLAGGLFALRYRRYLRQILGLTAGVVLGVVAFDIIPELVSITGESGQTLTAPMVALLAGFLVFHAFEKSVSAHHAHEAEDDHHHPVPIVGVAAATGLIAHSFLDGVAIGVGFQASAAVGLAVALAVVAHDFSDGLNTVSLMLAHGNQTRRTIVMLLAGAIAPVVGALVGTLVNFNQSELAIAIGLLGGFLLYIGTSSVLPEAHRERWSWPIFGLTVVGAASVYAVSRALG